MLKLTNQNCEPGVARGAYEKKRGGAMYGMQQTIASAMVGTGKIVRIAPPVWCYTPNKVRLVKVAR